MTAALAGALGLVGITATSEAATRRTSAQSAATRAKAGKGKKSSTRGRRAQGPPRQAAPTPERYMEIQQVLADKGYYTGPINGIWGQDSVAALTRFQADHNLTPDGKLGALSLIALGLGPRRDSLADVAARPASEPPAEP